MKRWFRQIAREAQGLQCRSTLLLAFLVIAATGLSGALYLRISARLALERAVQHTRMLARSLAVASAEPMLRKDRVALLKIAQGLMPSDALVYVAFANVDGHILAGSQQGSGYLSRWLNADGSQISIGQLDRPTLMTDGGLGPRIDIVYPVADVSPDAAAIRPSPAAGFVRLGLSLATPERRLAAVTRQVIGIAVGIALLMVPLGFEIVHRIVAPINDLSTAAQRLAGGRLDTRVKVNRTDEIGRLGAAFNAMADDLAQSHNALVTLNAELEDRVLQRTEQLAESNRLLKIEIAEHQELVRAVSHDLHAPLRNVAGLTMILRRKLGNVPEPAAHCLERIEHNIQYEISLIDELLELSRVRAEREPPQLVDLDTEVRGIAQQLGFELERKKIRFRVESRLPCLNLERRRIRRLFQNLIDNAIKYTPAPEPGAPPPTITIAWRAVDRAYEFRVADRGIGVRPEDRDQVFNVFNRARVEYVSQTSGKGVGLAYCKSIVQGYGGRIWIEENPGGGSVFCFTLARATLNRRLTSPAASGRRGPAKRSDARAVHA